MIAISSNRVRYGTNAPIVIQPSSISPVLTVYSDFSACVLKNFFAFAEYLGCDSRLNGSFGTIKS